LSSFDLNPLVSEPFSGSLLRPPIA
jgi:hypothetical protein